MMGKLKKSCSLKSVYFHLLKLAANGKVAVDKQFVQ
jgi:hypothetical protein